MTRALLSLVLGACNDGPSPEQIELAHKLEQERARARQLELERDYAEAYAEEDAPRSRPLRRGVSCQGVPVTLPGGGQTTILAEVFGNAVLSGRVTLTAGQRYRVRAPDGRFATAPADAVRRVLSKRFAIADPAENKEHPVCEPSTELRMRSVSVPW